MRGLIFIVLVSFISCALSQTTSYLSDNDKNHLKSVLDTAWKLTDLSHVCYAAVGYKMLNAAVPNKQDVCQYVKKSVEGKLNAEQLYFASLAGKSLACPVPVPANTKQTLNDIKEDTPLIDIFFAVSALRNLAMAVEEAKILKLVLSALKKDDSILSLGYAFHIGAQLKVDTSAIFQRTDDAIFQADEVDGKMLQFEGGLSTTAFILSGVYKLAEATNRPVPVKKEQAIKFANYLMSRKSTNIPKGAYHILEVVNVLTNNKYHIPVSITVAGSITVSPDSPKIQLRIIDLMGQKLDKVKVTAASATEKGGNKAVLTEKSFSAVSGDASRFELDVMSADPPRGFYELSVNVEGPDSRLVGNLAASVVFKVLAAISLQDVRIGTADADQTTNPALTSVSYPSSLATKLSADYHQRVVLRFKVADARTNQAAKVHQAFVKVTNTADKREVVFIADRDTAGIYKFDMGVSENRKQFSGVSGLYSVELIVGDASVSNSFVWKVAEVALDFAEDAADSKVDYTYKAQPEIHHLFREPDSRPPRLVSLAFTLLCLSPLALLLFGWMSLGVNISNFPFSLSSIGFHCGIGAIFGLFCWFWLELNMFTTMKYLFCLAIVTFLCGHSMLASIAGKRKEK